MDELDISKKLYEESFLTEYESKKEQILSTLQSLTDNCELVFKYDAIVTLTKVLKGKEPMQTPLNINENGIEIYSYNDEIIKELTDNIPKNIKNIKISYRLMEDYPDILNKFDDLESLEVVGHGCFDLNDIKQFVGKAKLKHIYCSQSFSDDLKNSSIANLKPGEKTVLQIGNLTIESTSIIKPDYIVYNDDISKLSSFLHQGDIATNRFQIPLYRNGNKVLLYRFESKSLEIVLNEKIEESYNLAKEFLNATGFECNNITIRTTNKTYDNMEYLKNFENIAPTDINYGDTHNASVSDYLDMRGNLDYFVSLINQNNLSPVEKLCYAYDLVKSHIYTEDEETKGNSRYIHSIVSTGKIVCVGYSVFLAELLKEVGIEAYAIGTSVPLKDGTTAGHERCIVIIHDSKYDIDGTYALDCTWDSNKIMYRVDRDGREILTTDPKENDNIVYTFDNMSLYNHFLIAAQDYNKYFPGERFYRNIKDWHPKEFNPMEAAVESIPEMANFSKTEEVFDDTRPIDEETILSIIYNTRFYEGYSKEENDRLIDEVREIRNKFKPRELVSEKGMQK